MKRIKRLMGDKLRFENTKMRVIKWESVWNDDRQEKYGRERERESYKWYLLRLWTKPLRIVELLQLKRWGD